MFSWSDVNLLQVAVVLLTSLVIVKSYVIYSLFGENAQLKVNHSDAKNMQEYYRKVAEFRKAEVMVLDEMLATYRPLAKKLVSVHTTSTYLHLKSEVIMPKMVTCRKPLVRLPQFSRINCETQLCTQVVYPDAETFSNQVEASLYSLPKW